MVLTLAMVLSLAACGNDDTSSDQATDSTQVQTGDTTDNNQTGDTQSSDVDLAALRTQILTDCGITDSVNVETDALNNLYGITADQVRRTALWSPTASMWVCSSPPTMTTWSLPSRTHWPNPQPHPENEPTAGQS